MAFRRYVAIGILGLTFVAAHLLLVAMDKSFCLTQLTMSIYYAVVVMGLCLVMGYAGQISLGHGAFFAIGGYTTAVLTTSNLTRFEDASYAAALKHLHVLVMAEDPMGGEMLTVAPWAACVAAILFTLAVACLIGWPALRLKGHYLAMATLGFGLIVNKMLLGSTITGAADGITSVPEWSIGGLVTISGKSSLRVENYYMAAGLMLVLFLLMGNLLHSRIGRALLAIHDRETAANAMGINTAKYKLKAFVTSAVLAAVAGVLFTHYTGGISPSEASAIKSVRYVALAAAGGMANLWGVAIVSVIMNFLSLRGWFGTYDNAVFGALLILIISLAPEGPLKPIAFWVRRLVRKPEPQSEGEENRDVA